MVDINLSMYLKCNRTRHKSYNKGEIATAATDWAFIKNY